VLILASNGSVTKLIPMSTMNSESNSKEESVINVLLYDDALYIVFRGSQTLIEEFTIDPDIPLGYMAGGTFLLEDLPNRTYYAVGRYIIVEDTEVAPNGTYSPNGTSSKLPHTKIVVWDVGSSHGMLEANRDNIWSSIEDRDSELHKCALQHASEP